MSAPVPDVRAAALLEIWQQRFAGICAEMGEALRRGASSPNIKERADFSCALFSPDAELVAQAAHIPVHLGSMAASVRAVIDAAGDTADHVDPDDQIVVNDPFRGGTHLNDMTFVARVAGPDGTTVGWVANRAHHADVGGGVPGSLWGGAPDSVAEGLCLPPVRIVRGGTWDRDVRALVLANTRTPDERAGDLDAQWGANRLGARRLCELVTVAGGDAVAGAMREVLDHGERSADSAFSQLVTGTGAGTASDHLCAVDGTRHPLQVRVHLDVDGLHADFTGTAAAAAGVPSAVRSVTQACLEYVARVVGGPGVARNGGVTRRLHLTAPPGSVVAAGFPTAVGAGNVEASQRIVDVLLAACAVFAPERVGAASQGTMNNLLIGGVTADGRPFVTYETIGGGQGARPGRDGQSGVHTHMTNSANTPIEAFELEYPLTVERYGLRSGSGGAGRWRGGDGIERAVRLHVDATVTLLAERRDVGPPGRHGGADGAPGHDEVVVEGVAEPLPAKGTVRLPAGSVVVIRTPGGGGMGVPDGPP